MVFAVFLAGVFVGLSLGLFCSSLIASLMLRRLLKETLILSKGFVDSIENFRQLVEELIAEQGGDKADE